MIGTERAVDALLARLEQDSGVVVRRAAAQALGRIGSEQAVDALLACLEQNSDHSVKGSAARALGRIGSERAVDALLARLDQDSDDDVRGSAAKALGEIKSERGLPILGSVLCSLRGGLPELGLSTLQSAVYTAMVETLAYNAVDPGTEIQPTSERAMIPGPWSRER